MSPARLVPISQQKSRECHVHFNRTQLACCKRQFCTWQLNRAAACRPGFASSSGTTSPNPGLPATNLLSWHRWDASPCACACAAGYCIRTQSRQRQKLRVEFKRCTGFQMEVPRPVCARGSCTEASRPATSCQMRGRPNGKTLATDQQAMFRPLRRLPDTMTRIPNCRVATARRDAYSPFSLNEAAWLKALSPNGKGVRTALTTGVISPSQPSSWQAVAVWKRPLCLTPQQA